MAQNPDMDFSDMARQLNTSLSAIERTYDRLQLKRKIEALQQHKAACPETSVVDMALKHGLSVTQVRKYLASNN